MRARAQRAFNVLTCRAPKNARNGHARWLCDAMSEDSVGKGRGRGVHVALLRSCDSRDRFIARRGASSDESAALFRSVPRKRVVAISASFARAFGEGVKIKKIARAADIVVQG